MLPNPIGVAPAKTGSAIESAQPQAGRSGPPNLMHVFSNLAVVGVLKLRAQIVDADSQARVLNLALHLLPDTRDGLEEVDYSANRFIPRHAGSPVERSGDADRQVNPAQ